jgi:hypothetical protein
MPTRSWHQSNSLRTKTKQIVRNYRSQQVCMVYNDGRKQMITLKPMNTQIIGKTKMALGTDQSKSQQHTRIWTTYNGQWVEK